MQRHRSLLKVVFVSLALLALAMPALGREFHAAGNYALGGYPAAIVTGDFNRDGKLDIAVAHYGSNKISILFGNGDGSFRQRVTVDTRKAPNLASSLLSKMQSPAFNSGAHSTFVAMGDFNRDGLVDQAVISSGKDRVSVLLGGVSADVTQAVNLIANPGFESGALSPWFQDRNFCSGPCANWTVGHFMPFTGHWDAGNVGNIEVRQNFAATSTRKIRKVQLYLRHPEGSSLPAAIDFFYSDGTDDEFVVFTTDANWEVFDLTADLESGKMLMGISLFGFNGGVTDQHTFLDNVAVLSPGN